MKTRIHIILVSMMFLFSLSAGAQADKEAIKAVIEKETTSFFNVNRKDWDDSWIHESYIYWSYSDSTGTNFLEGWSAISKYFDEYFKTQVPTRVIDVAHNTGVTINRTWKEIRIYGNGAFVRYDQQVKDNKIHFDETSQVRVLEKKDGKWKVVCVSVIAKYPAQ